MGALSFAIWKPKNPLYAVKLGTPFVFLFYQLMVFSLNWQTAAVFMFLMGFSGYLMFAALTVGLQLDVSEDFRGRVSALVGLAFGSVGPICSFPVGRFSDAFGEALSIQIFSAVFFICSLIWYRWHKSIFVLESKNAV